MAFRIEREAKTRFWALYDGEELVCLTVYNKGAVAVQQRLAAQPKRPRAAAARVAAARTRSASQGGTPLVPPPPPRRRLGCGRGRCRPAPPPFSPRSPSVPTLSLGN